METLKKKYPKFTEAIVKIFAIMGLVIILLIAIYGAMAALRSIPNVWQAIGNAFTSVTSIFTRSDELSLRATPQTPISGENTKIQIKGRGLSGGQFEFSYECVDGVNFEVVSPTSNVRDFAFCNTRTPITVEDNSFVLIPTLVNKDVATVSLSVFYTKDGQDEPNANGELSLTVLLTDEEVRPNDDRDNDNNNDNRPGNTSTSTPTKRPTSPQVPNEPNGVLIPKQGSLILYGYSDLMVRVIDVGTINPITGSYSPSQTLASGNRSAVRFEVVNIGTNATGPWRWNASLPTDPFYMYPSVMQQSLNPGDKILYTLAFDGLRRQPANQVTIIVDPDNTVRESNEQNNTAIQSFKTTYSTNDGNCYITNYGSYICPDNNDNRGEDRARQAIRDAKRAIDDAEEEIDDAQDDGIDTDDAEDLLDDAEDHLDEAEEEFDDGNYDDARDLARDAEDLANDAIDEL